MQGLKFLADKEKIDHLVKEKGYKLYLKCRRCGQVYQWQGYPRNPKLSSIVCLYCGSVSAGAWFDKAVKESEENLKSRNSQMRNGHPHPSSTSHPQFPQRGAGGRHFNV